MADEREDLVVLTIRPEPKGVDAWGRDPTYRLKLLLKRMLRSWGWRCVKIGLPREDRP